MKVIGSDQRERTVVLCVSNVEWDALQQAALVPYDKRTAASGTEVSVAPINDAITALAGVKGLRKELANIQKKWDALASALDVVLEK